MIASASFLGVVLSAALKWTLLLTLAAAVERTMLRRRASAAVRHLLWTLTLGSALLLPALAWTLPAWGVNLPNVQLPSALRVEAPSAAPAPSALRSVLSKTTEPISTAPPTPSSAPAAERVLPNGSNRSEPAAPVQVQWFGLLLGAYLAGMLLLLARVAAEQLVVRRLARGATRVTDPEWSMLLQSLAATVGVRRPVVLLRSQAPTVPLAWGVVRPFILLPSGADEWSPSRRKAVLLHELAHVARHDCLTQMIAAITCAFYWPHPGMWWAARRMRAERELACDDQVLARGVHPREYAGHLLAIARTLQPPRPLTALAVSMAAPSHLEVRIRAAIDRTRIRTAPGTRVTVLGALLTTALLVPLAVTGEDIVRETPVSRAEAAPLESLAGGAAELPSTAGTDRQDATFASAQGPLGGEWTMRLAGAGEAKEEREAQGDIRLVHVALRAPGLNTFYVPLTRLDGLTAEQIAASDAAVRFRLREDAGTFSFEGSFRSGRGAGRFDFAPDPAFAGELARRGMSRPTPEQQFELARHDVDLAFLDELAAQGYSQPSTEALVKVGMTGVDLQYLRGMEDLGYRLGTVEALVELSNHSIGPAFIQQLASLGYRGLSPADLLRMGHNGLRAEFVREMNTRAGRQLSVDELIDLRTHGSKTVSRFKTTPLEGRWVVHRTQDAHLDLELFWTDGTNWRRWRASSEFHGLSDDELLSLASSPVSFRIEQDAGTFEFEGTFRSGRGTGDFRFRPNRQFTSTLRSLAVQGVGEVTDHQLKNLAYGGVGATAIREFKALGFAPLTLENAIDLAIYGVTPNYVRELQSLGVGDASTIRGVIDLRIYNVSAEYVRELAALGYRGLSGERLSEMRRGRVTPAFIRSVHEAGYHNVSPELLIDMRKRGIEEIARRAELPRGP